jgi:hypothetical protein
MCWQILVILPNIKYDENSFSHYLFFICDRQISEAKRSIFKNVLL